MSIPCSKMTYMSKLIWHDIDTEFPEHSGPVLVAAAWDDNCDRVCYGMACVKPDVIDWGWTGDCSWYALFDGLQTCKFWDCEKYGNIVAWAEVPDPSLLAEITIKEQKR